MAVSIQNCKLHGHCWVYSSGQLIALKTYQEGEVVSEIKINHQKNLSISDYKDE
jgi:hypothetical protein